MDKKYYQRNREKILAKQKEYYADNREQILERDKKYRQSLQVKARIRERGKEYRQLNKDRIREYHKSYTASGKRKEHHKTAHAKQVRKIWSQSLTGSEIIRKNARDANRRRRLKLLEIIGSECIGCGFSDNRALQFDHIDNDGRDDRKRFGSSANMYRYYINHPDEAKLKLQILCANCNWIKIRQKTEGAVFGVD